MKEYQNLIMTGVIALAIIFSTIIFTNGVIKYQKLQNQTISVTGSASENVKSDRAVLNFSYKAQANDLKTGYKIMGSNRVKIMEFLKSYGINEADVEFKQITNYEVNKRYGNYTTNEIDFYRFNSEVRVSSSNIDLITKISKNVEGLINKDVEINYSNVEYFVSNLDDIKIKMVGEATKNAKSRAASMVKSTGGRIGSLNSAKMGVFQIVPVNSTEVSDYGINDTSSIEKKVVAVVNATFTVK